MVSSIDFDYPDHPRGLVKGILISTSHKRNLNHLQLSEDGTSKRVIFLISITSDVQVFFLQLPYVCKPSSQPHDTGLLSLPLTISMVPAWFHPAQKSSVSAELVKHVQKRRLPRGGRRTAEVSFDSPHVPRTPNRGLWFRVASQARPSMFFSHCEVSRVLVLISPTAIDCNHSMNSGF